MEDRCFVVNAADEAARWVLRPGFGKRALLEPRDARFSQVGIHLAAVGPGEHSTLYHAEESQEDFLVLRGSCTAIVQDGERLTGSPPGQTKVARAGLEPATPRFSAVCSTN
jgi:hypothetical protein